MTAGKSDLEGIFFKKKKEKEKKKKRKDQPLAIAGNHPAHFKGWISRNMTHSGSEPARKTDVKTRVFFSKKKKEKKSKPELALLENDVDQIILVFKFLFVHHCCNKNLKCSFSNFDFLKSKYQNVCNQNVC
jgi:hypothetical protein